MELHETKRVPRLHRTRQIVRRSVGWLLLLIGVLLVPLPGPGIVVIALGVTVLGTREPLLRRTGIGLRLWLRRLSRSRRPHVRRWGISLHTHHRQARHTIHHFHARRAAGEPLPHTLWLALAASVVGMIASVALMVWLTLR